MDKKDVIYVDADEDITDIVVKIKKSAAKIIALVPPKRTGALSSIVNLKLLAKVAKNSDRHLVIISNSQALLPLAAAAQLPVAKTLQSKPEIPEVAKLETDDGETEIIEGEEIPVKDSTGVNSDVDDALLETIAVDGAAEEPKKDSESKKNKVPNFNKFRKRIIIATIILVPLIVFMVWAAIFAPGATIYIRAQTSTANISATARLVDQSRTAEPEDGILNVTRKEITKRNEVEFEPTGRRDIGERASGTITISNCDYSDGFTLASGTQFISSEGLRFVSQAAVTVPRFTGSASACSLTGSSAGTASVRVSAIEIGEEFNIAAGVYQISGMTGNVGASGTAMSGGSKRNVRVVSQEDISRARAELGASNEAEGRRELISNFGDDYIVIEASIDINVRDPRSEPGINREVTGSTARLIVETVYSGFGVSRSQLGRFLDAQAESEIGDDSDQRVYDNGLGSVSFDNFVDNDGIRSVTVRAPARVGPDIDEDHVKETARGRRQGDVVRLLGSTNGVRDVDVRFSFFWISTVPNDVDRIRVEFELDD